ncbi:MAG: hypothetical protein VYD90_13040 [Pseudomonadota bacterium]|nr:hypothetical protein [Pseudomonadota bacterium]
MLNPARYQELHDNLGLAEKIVDSAPVLGVFGACAWDELGEDGKLWISAIVTEALQRQEPREAPRPEDRPNVKAAPFALTPGFVRRAVEATAIPRLTIPPVSPRPTADEPKAAVIGHIEPARVAPAQAEPSAPAETPNLGRPDIAGDTSGTQADKDERRTRDDIREKLPSVIQDDRARQSRGNTPRRLAGPGREDRPARPLPGPVGSGDTNGRDILSTRKPVPPLMADVRRARLANAIAFLKARCILVDVVDRNADIRLYRVSGKQARMLACDVIAYAQTQGFEVTP